MKPRVVLEKVLGHVGNMPQDPLHRHLFRFVLQASDLVLAVFLPVIHPVQPAEVVTALQSSLVRVPKATFRGDAKDPECEGRKGRPFLQGSDVVRPHARCFPGAGGAPGCTPGWHRGWDQQHALYAGVVLLIRVVHPEIAPSTATVTLREWRTGFSRLFELPADVSSANERSFSTITFPSYPVRGKEGICASSSILFFSI